MSKNFNRPPSWYIVVIVVMLLPLIMWPMFITSYLCDVDAHSDNSVYAFLFPIYALLSAYYAYKTYTTRRELSIILLALLLLSYIAAAILLL